MREWIDLIENTLNEELSVPNQLANVDEIAKFVESNTDWTGGSGEQLMYEYQQARELDPDLSINIHSQDFKDWLKEWVEDQVYDAWNNFMHLFDRGGNAILYRMITAPADWKPDDRHPGIYWSWEEDAAEAHWGDFRRGHVRWLLTAKVNVDWTATLAMNVQPDYASEKEIRLKDNAPLELLNVERV